MKYLKYTYVDAVTGVPVTDEPSANGPADPAVKNLKFCWARESQYPTNVPEFFGTCPDESETNVPGVLSVIEQADWEQMRADEMRARIPRRITMRQARLALLQAGLLSGVDAAIDSLPSPQKEAARIEWEYSQEVQRHNGFVSLLAPALGLTDAQLDDLFVVATKL